MSTKARRTGSKKASSADTDTARRAGKIAPGPATNTGGFEAKVTDPEKAGKLKTATAGQNATVAGGQAFEQRVASDPGH
jgi:hypothetical protein